MLDQLGQRILRMAPAIGESLLISAGILLSLMLVEIALIGWARSSLKRLLSGSASARTDLVSAILVLSNISLLLGTLLFFGLIYLMQSWLRTHIDLRLLDHVQQPWLAYVFFIAALDFSNYWTHRLMHRIGPLWEIHKYHHSADEMTMLTALRDHPMERALLHGINAIPVAMLGMPPEHYLGAQLALQGLGFLKHSNLNNTWGHIGTWVIQSPAAHRLHHSADPRDYNCNFASVFQFWDVLFGTARNTTATEIGNTRIGLNEEPWSETPLRAMTQVVQSFYGQFKITR
ncbi:sterol desaturase family protein [Kinneretia aquatilis]|uniref:sterol desaturase family protein n=1 Tax=Kinneretia aquatilis TaxID=2070761 RepID=UPI001CC10182|nr:sterol desaturase family protein [Paucibacter aquatile]WIW00286.1 sterol desaturase family protein [Paucibacter aquatile]